MSLVARFTRGLELLSAIAVILVALLVVRKEFFPTTPVSAEQMEEDVTLDASLLTKRMGTANLVLVEFADFQCPYCAQHAKDTFPRIKRELIDTGLVSYAYLHFPLQEIHPQAFAASEAAECASRQNKYWEMHDRIYAQQQKLNRGDLLNHAESLGIDLGAFAKCLDGEVKDIVKANIEAAQLANVRSTPSFFIGRIEDKTVRLQVRIQGAAPFASFKEEVEAASRQREGWWRRWIPSFAQIWHDSRPRHAAAATS